LPTPAAVRNWRRPASPNHGQNSGHGEGELSVTDGPIHCTGLITIPNGEATLSWVDRDGDRWQVGTAGDVAWITEATTYGVRITSAIPPVFDSYATVVAADS